MTAHQKSSHVRCNEVHGLGPICSDLEPSVFPALSFLFFSFGNACTQICATCRGSGGCRPAVDTGRQHLVDDEFPGRASEGSPRYGCLGRRVRQTAFSRDARMKSRWLSLVFCVLSVFSQERDWMLPASPTSRIAPPWAGSSCQLRRARCQPTRATPDPGMLSQAELPRCVWPHQAPPSTRVPDAS